MIASQAGQGQPPGRSPGTEQRDRLELGFLWQPLTQRRA
jgi:hypothetical protein